MAKQPDKSAGTIKTAKTSFENEVIKKAKGFKTQKEYFRVRGYNENGFESKEEGWWFALLPAIEDNLQYSPNSNLKGTQQVPEVKPGILNNSTIKYKSHLIPGGNPAIQAIGVQSTQYQLVGLFIGTEGKTKSAPGLYKEDANAVQLSERFDREYVRKMREVIVEISSDVEYSYRGVITNFKFYQRRADRVYFVMDILGTMYD